MLFHIDRRNQNAHSRKVYAMFEIIYTIVDFLAALLFLIGSIMFLSESWEAFGTWLFILGSIMFAAKPALRLVRELKLAALGDTEALAERIEN